MLRLYCDRCENYESPVEIFGYVNENPYANAFGGKTYADVKMPEGWQKILGKHLCASCMNAVEKVLSPIPQGE